MFVSGRSGERISHGPFSTPSVTMPGTQHCRGSQGVHFIRKDDANFGRERVTKVRGATKTNVLQRTIAVFSIQFCSGKRKYKKLLKTYKKMLSYVDAIFEENMLVLQRIITSLTVQLHSRKNRKKIQKIFQNMQKNVMLLM